MITVAGKAFEKLLEDGFTRSEALTLVLVEGGATSVTIPPAPTMLISDDERFAFERDIAIRDAQISMLKGVVESLKRAIAPQYLTEEDVEQLINDAVKEHAK